MTRIRNKNYDRYTTVNNEILRDGNLSIAERGMLVTLLSLPDKWDFSIAGLNAILKSDGKSRIGSTLKKLEEKGYLVRRQIKDAQGKFGGLEWEIYDSPQADYPHPENRDTDNPYPGNVSQYNTNRYNTNRSNNDDDIISYFLYFDKKSKNKTKQTQKLKKQIHTRLDELGGEELLQYLDYIVSLIDANVLGDFVPTLDYITGTGFNEYYRKFKNRKIKFRSMEMRQDYDMDAIERDMLAN